MQDKQEKKDSKNPDIKGLRPSLNPNSYLKVFIMATLDLSPIQHAAVVYMLSGVTAKYNDDNASEISLTLAQDFSLCVSQITRETGLDRQAVIDLIWEEKERNPELSLEVNRLLLDLFNPKQRKALFLEDYENDRSDKWCAYYSDGSEQVFKHWYNGIEALADAIDWGRVMFNNGSISVGSL